MAMGRIGKALAGKKKRAPGMERGYDATHSGGARGIPRSMYRERAMGSRRAKAAMGYGKKRKKGMRRKR